MLNKKNKVLSSIFRNLPDKFKKSNLLESILLFLDNNWTLISLNKLDLSSFLFKINIFLLYLLPLLFSFYLFYLFLSLFLKIYNIFVQQQSSIFIFIHNYIISFFEQHTISPFPLGLFFSFIIFLFIYSNYILYDLVIYKNISFILNLIYYKFKFENINTLEYEIENFLTKEKEKEDNKNIPLSIYYKIENYFNSEILIEKNKYKKPSILSFIYLIFINIIFILFIFPSYFSLYKFITQDYNSFIQNAQINIDTTLESSIQNTLLNKFSTGSIFQKINPNINNQIKNIDFDSLNKTLKILNNQSTSSISWSLNQNDLIQSVISTIQENNNLWSWSIDMTDIQNKIQAINPEDIKSIMNLIKK